LKTQKFNADDLTKKKQLLVSASLYREQRPTLLLFESLYCLLPHERHVNNLSSFVNKNRLQFSENILCAFCEKKVVFVDNYIIFLYF